MTGSTRAKKQHFVPRFYLERFVDNERKLWVHDSRNDRLRYTTSENTGYETNIYSPEVSNGERFDQLEMTLSKIESIAADIIYKLTSAKPISNLEKSEFAMFLATLFARSPAQLRQFAAFQGEVSHWMAMVELERHNQGKEEEGTLSQSERDQYELLADKNNYEMIVDRRVGLISFEQCEDLANLMSQMSWTFEISEEQQIITSDNSVFWVNGGPEPISKHYGFGLGHRQAVIPFPLNPNTILRLDWQRGSQWTKHRLSKRQAKLSNQYQAKHKDNLLFFRERDSGLQKLGMKYAEPVKQLTAGVEGPRVTVVRKLDTEQSN